MWRSLDFNIESNASVWASASDLRQASLQKKGVGHTAPGLFVAPKPVPTISRVSITEVAELPKVYSPDSAQETKRVDGRHLHALVPARIAEPSKPIVYSQPKSLALIPTPTAAEAEFARLFAPPTTSLLPKSMPIPTPFSFPHRPPTGSSVTDARYPQPHSHPTPIPNARVAPDVEHPPRVMDPPPSYRSAPVGRMRRAALHKAEPTDPFEHKEGKTPLVDKQGPPEKPKRKPKRESKRPPLRKSDKPRTRGKIEADPDPAPLNGADPEVEEEEPQPEPQPEREEEEEPEPEPEPEPELEEEEEEEEEYQPEPELDEEEEEAREEEEERKGSKHVPKSGKRGPKMQLLVTPRLTKDAEAQVTAWRKADPRKRKLSNHDYDHEYENGAASHPVSVSKTPRKQKGSPPIKRQRKVVRTHVVATETEWVGDSFS